MKVPVRKFVVGLTALAVLVAVYLFYARANRMPAQAVALTKMPPPPVVDVNTGPSEAVGTIVGVGIDRVEQTRFLHRNEHNQVDRDLGFDQLLHKVGNQWEITHPYLKLFFPTFQCVVTANRGKVQVETAFSKPMASDATFEGNVIIHIVPAEPNNALECFIHLDDVGFQAAKSLFSSGGAVRFLSRRAQLTGRGLDLVYDEGRSRLELFRILHLESLRLRSRELGSVADLKPKQRSASAALPRDADATQAPVIAEPNTPAGERYQCLFHRNVTITLPDRVIAARDVLAIDNIMWSGSKKPDTRAQEMLDRDDPNATSYPGAQALDTTTSAHAAVSSLPPEYFDTVVTCDAGFEVSPMDSRLKLADTRQNTEDGVAVRPASPSFADRQHATARRIHFNALTTDTTLAGPVEMAFLLDPNGLQDAKKGANAMPMTITAQESVRFLAAANQVLFAGDCKVALSRSEPNAVYEYVLKAPQLRLDIASDSNKPKELAVTARRLVTEGGAAVLRILRKSPTNRVLGETELDVTQLQYEARPRGFTAVGPGTIWVRNDEVLDPKVDPNQFSLGRPCVARLTNFDRLTYLADTQRLVADDDAQQLLLDYFPLVNGKYARHTRAVVGHVEAALKEVVKGHLELATLQATQGIEYEDETGGQSFLGSTLSYDSTQTLVAIRGDAEQPCYLNGVQVDHIDLDLKTGRIQADVPVPSVFQVRR